MRAKPVRSGQVSMRVVAMMMVSWARLFLTESVDCFAVESVMRVGEIEADLIYTMLTVVAVVMCCAFWCCAIRFVGVQCRRVAVVSVSWGMDTMHV